MSQPFCFDCGHASKKQLKHFMKRHCRFWDPLELLFLICPWNVSFTDFLDFVLVTCSWILPYFSVLVVSFFWKIDAIFMEIWWKFGGSLAAVWRQFGGSLVAVSKLTFTSKRRD